MPSLLPLSLSSEDPWKTNTTIMYLRKNFLLFLLIIAISIKNSVGRKHHLDLKVNIIIEMKTFVFVMQLFMNVTFPRMRLEKAYLLVCSGFFEVAS
jgi:hypothetical protein